MGPRANFPSFPRPLGGLDNGFINSSSILLWKFLFLDYLLWNNSNAST